LSVFPNKIWGDWGRENYTPSIKYYWGNGHNILKMQEINFEEE